MNSKNLNTSNCNHDRSSKPFKVLVAEDNYISRRILEKKLIKWGYDVICVGNGKEALEAFETSEDARIALLDWMMPELDGVEVCKKIREKTGPDFLVVTPGIRPEWVSQSDDQERVMTPREAFESGASYIVIGRPVTEADDPAEAVARISDTL